MADTTAPTPLALSFFGTAGTLTWTEAGSPPVLNAPGLTSINVAGAGTSAANGNYTIQSSPDAYGCKYFQLGSSEFIYYNTSVPATPAWALGTILNGYHFSGAPTNSAWGVQYGVSGGAASSFPISGWATFFASNPVPTFTPNNGTTVWQANQGLTITGLSGGAVTISNVVTTGTATTFTISRTILSSETGGTFFGATAAFSDSASPPNQAAAFSIPITSSAFGAGSPPRNLTTVVVY